MQKFPDTIEYSEKYYDSYYEYRHVVLPKAIYETMAKNKLLEEQEWRDLGVTMSYGWIHYAIHKPEPFVLLFRRPKEIEIND